MYVTHDDLMLMIAFASLVVSVIVAIRDNNKKD